MRCLQWNYNHEGQGALLSLHPSRTQHLIQDLDPGKICLGKKQYECSRSICWLLGNAVTLWALLSAPQVCYNQGFVQILVPFGKKRVPFSAPLVGCGSCLAPQMLHSCRPVPMWVKAIRGEEHTGLLPLAFAAGIPWKHLWWSLAQVVVTSGEIVWN